MMEVIIAIAFFAIMVGMIVTIFQASSKISIDNFVAREDMNNSLLAINKIKAKEEASNKSSETITIKVDGNAKGTINLTLVKEGPFKKYVR